MHGDRDYFRKYAEPMPEANLFAKVLGYIVVTAFAVAVTAGCVAIALASIAWAWSKGACS